ncbi:MAG: hypothetical protein ABW223_01805 [Rariglobus sp.]
MNKTTKLLLTTTAAALFAGVSFANVDAGAQVNATVNNATNAVQNATTNATTAANTAAANAQAGVNNATQAATNATNQAVNGATQAGRNATNAATGAVNNATQNVANTTANTSAAVNSATSANGSLDANRPLRDGITASGELTNSLTAGADVNGRGLAAGTSQTLAGSLNTTQVVRDIRSTAFQGRDQLVSALDQRISQTKEATANVASRLNSEAREQSRAALKRAEKAHDRVKSSLEKARDAAESRWDKARERLAEDFEAYARATAEIEVGNSAASSSGSASVSSTR